MEAKFISTVNSGKMESTQLFKNSSFEVKQKQLILKKASSNADSFSLLIHNKHVVTTLEAVFTRKYLQEILFYVPPTPANLPNAATRFPRASTIRS